MPDKTLKTLLITVNIISFAIIIALASVIHSFKSNIASDTEISENIPVQTESVQNNQIYSTPNESLSQESDKTVRENIAKPDKFTIKAYNGKVAVFIEEEKRPIIESNIDISQLTNEDARLLNEGITANDLSQLFDILEDYDY